MLQNAKLCIAFKPHKHFDIADKRTRNGNQVFRFASLASFFVMFVAIRPGLSVANLKREQFLRTKRLRNISQARKILLIVNSMRARSRQIVFSPHFVIFAIY